jgi:ribosomal protein L22
MGRAHPYQRRTCHIVVEVAEKHEAAAPASR